MNTFSCEYCVAHAGEDANEFVREELATAEHVLFVGTVGLDTTSHFYPGLLSGASNVDFRLFIEQRPSVSPSLMDLGAKHRAHLTQLLPPARTEFFDIEVVAPDGATVAGRNAVRCAAPWLQGNYSDIVVDATGMSRGTCFPVVQRAMHIAETTGANLHVLAAARRDRHLKLQSESNDRADWIHGFQSTMGTDRSDDALKLWVPQLAEDTGAALAVMYEHISPVAEVCPIIPFPSSNPLRGDRLLLEHSQALRNHWECSSLNVIYGHESNPIDVFRTISSMHRARQKVFSAGQREAVTILSPNGWRIGSLGMLLAAIELKLPMLYVEAVGYTCLSQLPTIVEAPCPDVSWHLWLSGKPYRNGSQV